LPAGFWKETPRTVFAAIRGYHRRRGWMAWHIAALPRLPEMPELHDLTGREPPPEETDEERADRIYRNSMAWVIVTGGAQTEPEGTG
jgi:hypothetical protein